MTVESACERFLANAGISPATRRAYGNDLREFASWFGPDSPLEDVDVRVLADWVSDLGRVRARGKLSPSSISRKLVAVRSLLRYSLGPERVPDAALAPKRPRRLPDAPKLAEVEGVIAGFDDGDELIETGARRHESSFFRQNGEACDQILGSGNSETRCDAARRFAKEATASTASPSTTGGNTTMLTADQP